MSTAASFESPSHAAFPQPPSVLPGHRVDQGAPSSGPCMAEMKRWIEQGSKGKRSTMGERSTATTVKADAGDSLEEGRLTGASSAGLKPPGSTLEPESGEWTTAAISQVCTSFNWRCRTLFSRTGLCSQRCTVQPSGRAPTAPYLHHLNKTPTFQTRSPLFISRLFHWWESSLRTSSTQNINNWARLLFLKAVRSHHVRRKPGCRQSSPSLALCPMHGDGHYDHVSAAIHIQNTAKLDYLLWYYPAWALLPQCQGQGR